MAEVRDGLALLPTHGDLQQLLLEATPVDGAAAIRPTSISPLAPPPQGDGTLASVGRAIGARPPVGGAAAPSGPPPPDVPLLFEWEQPVPTLEVAEEGAGSPGRAGGEALPKELQALLEDSDEAEPVVVDDGAGAPYDQAMADDVAEAEFYLSQGMTEEARAVHRRMQLRDPQDTAVIALARQIEHAATAVDPAEPEPVAVLEFEPPDAPLVTAPSASAAVEKESKSSSLPLILGIAAVVTIAVVAVALLMRRKEPGKRMKKEEEDVRLP